MKVLITGGSGMLGSAITKKLISENISVVHLTRNKSSKHDIKNYEWDWEKNKIDLINGHVDAINFEENTLLLSSKESIQYDHLILATGSTSNKSFNWSEFDVFAFCCSWTLSDVDIKLKNFFIIIIIFKFNN